MVLRGLWQGGGVNVAADDEELTVGGRMTTTPPLLPSAVHTIHTTLLKTNLTAREKISGKHPHIKTSKTLHISQPGDFCSKHPPFDAV